MKIAVTGARGLLGSRVAEVLGAEHEVLPLDHASFEITDLNRVGDVLEAERPDAVVHCAAIPNPDTCEQDPDRAYLVNATGVRNVAVGCRKVGAAMVYISTDFVFDGSTDGFYREDDPTGPVNVYGKMKLLGERFLREQTSDFFVVRNPWLFDETFVGNIMEKARAGEKLRLIADKFSAPTFTTDVAKAINALLHSGRFGTYHVANHGAVSRVGQAEEILRQAGIGRECIENMYARENKAWVAQRPNRTPLEPYRIETEGIFVMPSYSDAVRRCLENLNA